MFSGRCNFPPTPLVFTRVSPLPSPIPAWFKGRSPPYPSSVHIRFKGGGNIFQGIGTISSSLNSLNQVSSFPWYLPVKEERQIPTYPTGILPSSSPLYLPEYPPPLPHYTYRNTLLLFPTIPTGIPSSSSPLYLPEYTPPLPHYTYRNTPLLFPTIPTGIFLSPLLFPTILTGIPPSSSPLNLPECPPPPPLSHYTYQNISTVYISFLRL